MADLAYTGGGDGITRQLPELDPAQLERARALLGGFVGSLHEHPVLLPSPLNAEAWASHMAVGADRLAGDELAASQLDVVIATCFSQPRFDFIENWAAGMSQQIGSHPGLRQLRLAGDLVSTGATAVGLGLEDLGPVTSLGQLDTLSALGIVMAGVAYNDGSPLGCGLAQHDTGLTAFGRDAIAHLNSLGIAIDVSHAGDRTSLEAIDASAAPVLINHAGAAGLWASARMVPDDVIRAAAASGGLIGIEAAPGSTRVRAAESDHSIDDVIAHIEYCAELTAVTAVAIGGDTFYGDHVGLYKALGSRGAPLPDGAVDFDLEPVAGADNPTELPVQLAYGLLARGWSDEDVALVLGGNLARVLGGILPGGVS